MNRSERRKLQQQQRRDARAFATAVRMAIPGTDVEVTRSGEFRVSGPVGVQERPEFQRLLRQHGIAPGARPAA